MRRVGVRERRVRLVHIGLVVLVVVDAHRLLVDVRLERAVVVGKRWNLESHLRYLRVGIERKRPCRLRRRGRPIMLVRVAQPGRRPLATLVFNAEEIAPRELKPALYELDGISRDAVEAHYKLYEGYVSKRNEILAKLAEVDLSAANQVYSEIRALKIDLT